MLASIAIPVVEAPPERMMLGLLSTAICLGLPTASVGVACFVSATGLPKRKPWAYAVAVLFGSICVLSCAAAPLGAVILYGLLRPGVREAFFPSR